MFKLLKKAQSTVEFAALICIIIGAMIAGGVYFKRGLQGRWKSSIDDLGDQYDPRVADTDVIHRMDSNALAKVTTRRTSNGYWTTREDFANTVETKTGTARTAASP